MTKQKMGLLLTILLVVLLVCYNSVQSKQAGNAALSNTKAELAPNASGYRIISQKYEYIDETWDIKIDYPQITGLNDQKKQDASTN